MYFSHPLHPERRPADPAAADALAYSNSKLGIWAMVLVYLGGCRAGPRLATQAAASDAPWFSPGSGGKDLAPAAWPARLPVGFCAACRCCFCCCLLLAILNTRGCCLPSTPAGYSVVQGPSTCMVRPHPAVWRLVHGIMVCYLMLMTYLLFQTVDDARLFLRVRRAPRGCGFGGTCCDSARWRAGCGAVAEGWRRPLRQQEQVEDGSR